jgi:sugar (pentulose or hexulose) kinase
VTTVVLDVGKTHVRLAAVDVRGAALESISRHNEVREGPPYPHFETEGLFDWIVEGLAALARRNDITEIVPIAHGACAALIAGDELALPILDYEFAAPESLASYEASARRFEETFSPKLPAGLNLGRQLAWLSARFPHEFARVDRVLLLPQYWAWRLCGVAASEVTSLGCHTDLWAPESGVFSKHAVLRKLDSLFPPLAPAWSPLGSLRPQIAKHTGIGANCAVLAGVHDSNASYLAHLATRTEPFAVVSSGTWVVVMAHGGGLGALDAHRDTLANVDVFGAPVATARFMGGREFAAIAGEAGAAADADGNDILASIDRGDLALPTFAPGVGPFPHAASRLELAAPQDWRARAAAAALYCALVTDECLRLVEARGEVIVEGPFARNRAYSSALAGLRARQRVLASDDATGTFAGAARLALWSRGGPSAPGRLEPPAARTIRALAPERLAEHRARWRAMLG